MNQKSLVQWIFFSELLGKVGKELINTLGYFAMCEDELFRFTHDRSSLIPTDSVLIIVVKYHELCWETDTDLF